MDIVKTLENEFNELNRNEDKNWVVEWVLKRKGQIESTRQAVKNRFKEIMADLDKEEEAMDNFYGSAFKSESDKLIRDQRKKKSVKLLTGTIGYRTQPDKLVITDINAAILWSYENFSNNDFIDAVKNIDIEAAKKLLAPAELRQIATDLYIKPLEEHIKTTGEIPDGCEYIVGKEVFYAKPITLSLPEKKDA